MASAHITIPRLSLKSLPVEIKVHIFESCACFNDLLSLATTCKELYDAYSFRAGPILWRIALNSESLYAIDVALIAVRVTQVVKDAYKADRLPRGDELFPLKRFESTRCLPNLNEFKNVLALQCFAQAFEDTCKRTGITKSYLYMMKATDGPSFGGFQLWRRTLYRHVFRLLVCGAALSGAYMEPFLDMMVRSSDAVIKTMTSAPFLWNEDAQMREQIAFNPGTKVAIEGLDRQALGETLGYLKRFPVFKMACQKMPSDGREVRVFRPAMDWLAADLQQEIRFNAKTNALPPMGNREQYEDDTMCLIRQVMGLKAVELQLSWKLRTNQYGRAHVASKPLSADELDSCIRSVPAIKPYTNPLRTITVFRYGVYQPEEIILPLRVDAELKFPMVQPREADLGNTHVLATMVHRYPPCLKPIWTKYHGSKSQLNPYGLLTMLRLMRPNEDGEIQLQQMYEGKQDLQYPALPGHRFFNQLLREHCDIPIPLSYDFCHHMKVSTESRYMAPIFAGLSFYGREQGRYLVKWLRKYRRRGRPKRHIPTQQHNGT